MSCERLPSRIDLLHLSQPQDPPLLTHPQVAAPSLRSETLFGLPTYQANSSYAAFDFGPMEEFAVTEKTTLGISSVHPKFSLEPFRPPPSSSPSPQDTPGPSDQRSESPNNLVEDSPRPNTSMRHRTISQSHAHPRTHRKGIGGKMALFETPHLSPPGVSGIPSLTSRLGLARHADSPLYDNLGPGSSPPNGGILNTGHDRPYRFSFYSNVLAATIHARSLSELPAEGQSFEDLFSGNHPAEGGTKAAPRDADPKAATPGFAANRSHVSDGYNTASNKNLPRRYNQKLPGGPAGSDQPGESDINTWCLDVLSPTDEEMKLLSKARSVDSFHFITQLLTLVV